MPTLVEGDISSPVQHETFRFCIPIFPASEFVSSMVFHCAQYAPFSSVENGRFGLATHFYVGGKHVQSLQRPAVGQDDILEINFSEEMGGKAEFGMAIVEMLHPIDQPIDPYVVHEHVATGSIVSHPLVLFMGESALGQWLSSALENALFWPGLVSDADLESVLVVLNPYDSSLKYQVTLYGRGALIDSSKVLNLPPKAITILSIEELFSQVKHLSDGEGSECSICISTQYAAKALFGIRHRTGGYYTVLDHLHEYIFR